MTRFKRATGWLFIALAIVNSGQVLAQSGSETESASSATAIRENESISSYVDRIIEVTKNLNIATAADRKEVATERAGQVVAETLDQVFAQPTTPPAGGFGSRVAGALTDFLPLFNFAVDSIDTAQDQKSVTVTFNPLQVLPQSAVLLTARISEPEASGALLEAIPESLRNAQKEAIADELDDFSDIIWQATFGVQWATEKSWNEAPALLFGRNPKLYETLISKALLTLLTDLQTSANDDNSIFLGDCDQEISTRLKLSETENIDSVEAGQVKQALDGSEICPFDEYVEAKARGAKFLLLVNEKLLDSGVDDFAALIANQPQLTFEASYRDRDMRSGQDETRTKLGFEWGFQNLSTAVRRYQDSAGKMTPMQAVQDVMQNADSKHRLSASLVWQQRAGDAFSYDYVERATDTAGNSTDVMRTATLDLKDSEEWCGQLSYSRAFPALAFQQDKRGDNIEGENLVIPMLEIAGEYIDVKNDPMREDRTVVRVSYITPGPAGMTIPISLTYADKPEFLGDQDHTFGAHVGISYKLGKPDSD